MTERDAPRRIVGSERVLAVLVELASLPTGATLEGLAGRLGQNKATVHHALGALCRSGLATRSGRGHYVLGDEFLRLAFAHYEARPEDPRIRPLMRHLADRFGETVHLATLDGRDVVYRAKVDPASGTVRLTSTVGGRNPAHSTGIGKVLLADRLGDLEAVRAWIGAEPLLPRTPSTATTAEELHARLERVRVDGYALDEQENEVLVNCIAFPLRLGPEPAASHALSVSALAPRTPLDELAASADEIRALIDEALDHPAPAPQPLGRTT